LSPSTSNASGGFTAAYTVPSKPPAAYTVTVTDAASNSDSATYTIHTYAFIVSAPASVTAGNSFNISVTAQLDGSTDTTYTGSHSITFSGPGDAPSDTSPTYPASVSFTNGVANSVPITLVDAETVKLSASDGAYSGQSANIAVGAGAAAGLIFTNATNKNGSVTITCTGTVGASGFTCTNSNSSGGNGRSNSARISLIDQFQNITTNTTGSAITVTLSSTGNNGGNQPSPTTLSIANNASTSGGSFTQTLNNGSGAATITATASIPASVSAKWTAT
jgi:hypothetical protein